MADVRAGDQSSLSGSVSAGQGGVANGLQLDYGVCCPACATVVELEAHRDATAGTWSIRRGVLNFAVLVARRNCPAYVATAPTDATLEDD